MRQQFISDDLKQITFLDERYYKYNDIYLPSVTFILDVYPKGFGFNQWLKDVGDKATEIANRAAERGSTVHNAIEMLIKNKELRWLDDNGNNIYSEEEWVMITRFSDFWNRFKPALIGNEIKVYSVTLGYAGTVDLIVVMNGVTWLLDIKTSNYIHKTHYMQIAAYAKAWNELNENKVYKIGVLWLNSSTRTEGKNGAIQGNGWQLKEPTESIDEIFIGFQHTHEIWKLENPDPRPKNVIYSTILKLN